MSLKFDGERWRELSAYLDQALEVSRAELPAWLESLRSKNPRLAADLQDLLAEQQALGKERFLEHSPAIPPRPGSLAGQTLGAYVLGSLIGQGGMGSVWLARRNDGRFEGNAAVKLLNAALIGRAGEERFKREGSFLARLTHPHIARLIDAGVSSAGQPYLVLEHVAGQRIDRYCDERKLTVTARVRLFLDVLSAMAHAHANLIVHRDIKPSNVLVSDDGQVKLLDFGIAKLLDDDNEATQLTREGGRALTPEYAAPEQLLGEPVTTATDVYALGVLLYVLVTGQHPAGDSVSSPAALMKAIVETEAPRLSATVTSEKGPITATLADNAARRATTPDRLRRLVHGDLDNIVAKALKKNLRERYASVTAFADDLNRYLRHEPVSARRDSLRYRAAKAIRRHRTAVALATLVVVALAGGLAGTITQAQRATRQAVLAVQQSARADREARTANEQLDFALGQLSRAEAINDLNSFLLSEAAPSGKPFTVGELLGRAEVIMEHEHTESDANRVEMLVALGRQYWSLDEDEKAQRMLGKAYEISRKLSDPSARAHAACAFAGSLARAGERERAESLIQDGLAELPSQQQFALHRIFCFMRGSEVAADGLDGIKAVARAEAAQGLLKELRFPSPLLELQLLMKLAESYRLAGRYRESIATFERASARLAPLGRDNTDTAVTLYNNWALALNFVGQPLQAKALFEQAIRISSADGGDTGVSPTILNNFARTLSRLNRFAAAADYAERAYGKAERAGDEMVMIQSLLGRAEAYISLGNFVRAASLHAQVEPRIKKLLAPGHLAFASLAAQKSLLAQRRLDFSAALSAVNEGIAILESHEQNARHLPHWLLQRADLYVAMHRDADARADAAKALQLTKDMIDPNVRSADLGAGYLILGQGLLAQGEFDPASAAFASALEQLRPTLGPDHPQTLTAAKLAAQVLVSRSK